MITQINNTNSYIHKRLIKHGFQFLKHPIEDNFSYIMKVENTSEYTSINKFKIPNEILNILRPTSIKDFLHFKIKSLHVNKTNKTKHFVSTNGEKMAVLSKSRHSKSTQLITPQYSYRKTSENNFTEELLQTTDGHIYHQMPHNRQKTMFHISKPQDKTLLSSKDFETIKEGILK